MDRWYAWVDNKMYGPYSLDQLSEFIQPQSMLCREGTEQWKPAKDFPELVVFWSGVPVEAPPSTGWMVRLAGSSAELGPMPKNRISEMIAKGEISPDDLVKHTDWDDWEKLSRTKLLEHKPQTETAPPPSPEEFLKVVQDSSNEELLREYNLNYKRYARREQKILKEELLRRGLIKKTLGLF